MVMNRRRKENTGNGVSSFADLEDQHRQDAQRQVQSVSRSSNINTRQAEQNMNNLIQQQNQQANVLRQYVDSQANRAEEDRSRLKEYVQEGTEDLAENLTRSVDKRGSGARGDDLLSEIASGQTLQSLEQQDLVNRAGEGIDEAGRYTKMGGQQLLRGSVNELNRIFNESEQGYMDWYQSSPENSYMQYAARNMNDQNADLTDINAGQDIQRQAQENFDRSRNWWRDALREKADSASDEELYQLFMAQNPTSNGDGFDPDKIRQNMRDTAELATDEWFTNVYNANENELSGTEAGQLLESVGSQVTRGTLAQLAGNALGGFGLNIANDPQAYMDAVNAMTGRASLGMMGYGIAGSSTGEKIAEGYDPDRALAYGLTQAGIELGTEKMGDVLAPLAQRAGIDTSWLFNNVTAGQAMGLRENIGEGFEEFVGQMLDPFSEAVLHPDMTAGDALQQAFSKENLSEALKAGVEGIASAALTGVATNPVQSAQMYAEDIQNLRNLPEQFDKDTKILANRIYKTNEYEKALSRELIDDPIANSMDAEAQLAKKAEIRDRFLSNENLRSEDALTREAAQAANTEYIKEQAKKYGINQNDADRITILSNRSGYMVEFADADQVVDANGKRVNGKHYEDGRIVLSDKSTEPIVAVAAHEIWHEIRGTQEASAYRRFLEAAADNGVLENFTKKYGDVKGLQNKIIPAYGINNIQDAYKAWDLLDDETSAYLTQELFGNEGVVDMMVEREPGLAQKVFESMQRFSAKIANNQTELDRIDDRRTLRKSINLFENAIDSYNSLQNRVMGMNLTDREIDKTNRSTRKSDLSNNVIKNISKISQFAINAEGRLMTLSEQIAERARRDNKHNRGLFVLAPNNAGYSLYGLPENSILTMRPSILNKILRHASEHEHGHADSMDVPLIERTANSPNEIAFAMEDGNGKYSFVYQIKALNKGYVMMAVDTNPKHNSSNSVQVTDISTMFGVDSLQDWIERQVKKGFTYIFNEKSNQFESVAGIHYPSAFSRSVTSNQSITDSTNKSSGSGAMYSRDLDTEGRELTADQQEYFKDSAIRDEDGNLRVVYHGTDQDFTVFDQSKGRANMDIQGSFFSPWEIDAGGYGSNVKAYYLNITNPASEQQGYAALRKFQGQNNAGVKAREYLESLGYDGVNNGDEEYIAFHPEQIKEIQNESPTDNPDVRYSRNLDSSGRELSEGQQSFFSESKIRDDEGRLLRTYHGTPEGGFTIYDRSRLGSQTHAKDAYLGHHFTDSKELADSFVILWDENQKGETKEQYLNITKPLDFYSIVMGKEFTDEEREQFNRDMKYILTGDADYVADWEDEDWDTFQTIAYSTRKELGQVKDELAQPEAYARMRELGYDGYIAPLQENDAEWLARKNYPYKDKREFVVFDSEQAKNVDNLNPTNNPDIRYSRDLLDDNNLAKVNPIMIQKGAGVVDYRLSPSERQIDRSKIPASVLDKAYTYKDFGKKFEKKNKMYSDMTWLGQQLRTAQEEVNRENAEYRGREAFGGAYGEVIRRLKEAGVKEPRDVVNQYLDNITWKGTAEADAAIENDPNASIIMSAIKTNLNPKFIQNLQDAHFASQRKAQKTRDESKVKGTEAYYRKSLEKGRSYVKERTGELLKGLGADIDLRMSPMQADRYFGGGEIHSPIGDARAALRASGITKTSEYSDWLKLYFLESLEGYKHNDEMLSRLKDKILADEQLATDSDMANGGFEYMLEQLDNAAKRYLRLKTEMEDPDYNNDHYMSDLYQVGTVVPLTENDHMSTATRDLRLAGALGTTANDPRLAQVAEKVESILRDRSADESETFRSYGRFDPNDKFGMNNPYMDRIYKETGIRDEWIINEIYHDMKLAHGRNNQRPYIPAPTQAEINLETAKRKAESAAKTREFFNNRNSLDAEVENAAANEVPEEPYTFDDYVRDYEEEFNNGSTSAYGDENYQWPTDNEAPAERQRKKTIVDIATEKLLRNDDYNEAIQGIANGYYTHRENYIPGKLISEMTDEDVRQAKIDYEQSLEDIKTIAQYGQNIGSLAKTLEQNREQISKNNEDVDAAMKRIFEDRLWQTKERWEEDYIKKLKQLEVIVKQFGIKPGSDESAAMQWYMERSKDTNAVNQAEVMYTLENLKEDFPDKWEDIKNAAELATRIYDEEYERLNESLEMNYPEKALLEEEIAKKAELDGEISKLQARLQALLENYGSVQEIARIRNEIREKAKEYSNVERDVRRNKRLPKRQHYAHHFMDVKPTLGNLWQSIKDVRNNEGHNNISNQLADTSEYTSPLSRWWGPMQQRNHGEYTSDAVGGLLRYLDMAERKIYFDPYIGFQRKVINELKTEADRAGRDMSSMIKYYSAWVNDLAGKTNPLDRWLTYAYNGKGRQVISVLKQFNSVVKANAVVGNIRSAGAQFYNLPVGIAVLKEFGGNESTDDWARGLKEYIADKTKPSRAVDGSVFLTERFLGDFTAQFDNLNTREKFVNAMLEFGDRAVAEQIWYAAKAQGERLGVENVIQYADELTRRSIAGRGIGEIPLSQKSQLVNLIAPFQVEVNNQWQVLKHLVGRKEGSAVLGMFLSTFIMNLLWKKVTNTDGTGMDVIAAILDALREDDEWRDLASLDEWKGKDGIMRSLLGNVAGEIAGNVPLGQQAVEFAGLSTTGYNSLFPEGYDPSRYGTGNIGLSGITKPIAEVTIGGKELKDVDLVRLISNYGLPYGGKQLERTVKTMQDLGWIPHFGNGVWNWKEGAYTANGDLKYVIDKDNPLDVARALIFGTYASNAGSEYLDNKKKISGNSVTVYDSLVDSGITPSDAYQVMRSLGDVEYPASTYNAKSLATRKALEDAGVWDEWSEAYNSIENKKDQDNFLYGTNSIGSTVAAMDEDEFQRAYDEIFGAGSEEAVNVPAETENVPTSVETADTVSSLSPSRQQAYDTVTSADIGVDSDSLSQTMSSLETKNLTDADGNKIDNSRSAVNRLSYEEDGSYQAIVDFIESDDNKNSDDPLTYADFGLSKSVVNMSDEELDELLEQINEGTGSTYRRRSGGSTRGNSRRANAFRRSGTSAIRSLGNQHISTYVPKKKGSYTRSTDTIKRLQQKTKSLSNGVMKTDVDLYDDIFNK